MQHNLEENLPVFAAQGKGCGNGGPGLLERHQEYFWPNLCLLGTQSSLSMVAFIVEDNQ